MRRRRRELALLKALGFTPADAGGGGGLAGDGDDAGSAWSSGCRSGSCSGGLLWSQFAAQLDVVDRATVPWL